jgi:hypothetical protein
VVHVAANDDVHPDRRLGADDHVADDLRALVDVGARIDDRREITKSPNHSITQSLITQSPNHQSPNQSLNHPIANPQ